MLQRDWYVGLRRFPVDEITKNHFYDESGRPKPTVQDRDDVHISDYNSHEV